MCEDAVTLSVLLCYNVLTLFVYSSFVCVCVCCAQIHRCVPQRRDYHNIIIIYVVVLFFITVIIVEEEDYLFEELTTGLTII